MARVSIYVTEELRSRMTEAGDALNWSDIARPAFESALADFNHRRGRSMETAIERLRASKQSYMEHAAKNGANEGRAWAKNSASYSELRGVSNIDLEFWGDEEDRFASVLKAAVDPEELHRNDDVAEMLFGEKRWPPLEWMVGWVRGAQEFFEEVEDQL